MQPISRNLLSPRAKAVIAEPHDIYMSAFACPISARRQSLDHRVERFTSSHTQMVGNMRKTLASDLKAPPRKEIPGTTITKHSFTVMPSLDTMLDTMTGRSRRDHVTNKLYNPKPAHNHYEWPSGV
jgi:protein required for attachment to host cells